MLRAYRGAVAALRASLQEPAVPATFQGPDPFISEETQPAEQADPAAPPSPRSGLGLRRRNGPGPDADDDRGLDSQAQLQDALTDELAVLAASLKSNTLAMEGRVRERGSLLDATETALDRSLVGVKASNLGATAIHRKCDRWWVLWVCAGVRECARASLWLATDQEHRWQTLAFDSVLTFVSIPMS